MGNLIDTDLYRHLGNEGYRDMEDWFSGGDRETGGRRLLTIRSGRPLFPLSGGGGLSVLYSREEEEAMDCH